MLALIMSFNAPAKTTNKRWLPAAMLFLYAVTFSFAYITLTTGTGALILFGAVQITMITITLADGKSLNGKEWLGLFTSVSGFVYLLLPGLAAPPLTGFLLMSTAGVAWGVYTYMGKSSDNALADTATNFYKTLPFVVPLAIMALIYGEMHFSLQGVLLAIASGALASALGYAIWYKALGGLTATQAGIVQLLVPIIAAVGGVVFASETIELRLIIASLLVLGGIALVFWGRERA